MKKNYSYEDSPSFDLAHALQAMKEQQLTRHILIPLLKKMHPGDRVEEAHGPDEAGRDIICFTTHAKLRRPFTLCVQVKNHRIALGATAGAYSIMTLMNQVEMARVTGITLQSGETVRADEIWVILTYPLDEGSRRKVKDILQKINEHNGQIIDGNELCNLLNRYCPELVSEMGQWKSKSLSTLIGSLSVHQESRAFGLRFDRRIDEFHVRARVCTSGSLTHMFLSNRVVISDHIITTYTVATWRKYRKMQKKG